MELEELQTQSEAPAAPETPPAPRHGYPERCYLAAVGVFLAAFALYLFTLAPNLMPGDTGDMVKAAATFQEAHPPGYPLYSLLGKLFTALPVADIPYRANLMSAFLGGLAVAFLFLALVTLTRHPGAALAGSFLFACNYLFWTYFTLAETFCMNNFFLALLAFLALLWRERHRQEPGGRHERRLLVWIAFLCGLSLGNHHTMLLTFPGLMAFVAATEQSEPRPSWRGPALAVWVGLCGVLMWVGIGGGIPKPVLAGAGLLIIAGFVAIADRRALTLQRLLGLVVCFSVGLVIPYLYLFIGGMVNHYHHWEDTGTLRGVLRLFFRVKYGPLQLAPGKGTGGTPPEQAAHYFGALLTQYLGVGYVLGLLGLLLAGRRDRSFLLYAGGGFLFGTIFILKANIDPTPTAYDAATLERFYQLPNFFFLLWAGFGLASLARAVEEGLASVRRISRPQRTAIVTGALLLLPAALGATNYPRANLRGNRLYPRFMENVYNSLPQGAILLAWSDTIGMGSDYLSHVEHARPDVAVILMGLAGSDPYKTAMRREYPHLYWSDTLKIGSKGQTAFISENLKKHRIFIDGLPRRVPFPVVRYGLIYEIKPRNSDPTYDEVLKANEAIWEKYDLRQVDTSLYPANSMCYSIVVFYYLYQRACLGTEYNNVGRWADALRHYQACLKMDPCGYVAKTPTYLRQVARAQAGLGHTEEALRQLEAVRKQAPDEPQTYELLAWVEHKAGHKAAAERWDKEYTQRQKMWDLKKEADPLEGGGGIPIRAGKAKPAAAKQ